MPNNTYWFVYNIKTKRFLWLARDDNEQRTKTIINMRNHIGKERHAAILIDNGFKLNLMADIKPTWENYANTNL